MGERFNYTKVVDPIYQRYKNPAKIYLHTTVNSPKGVRDEQAYQIADSFRQQIFSPTEFNISSKMLTMAVKQLDKFFAFRSWRDFKVKFQSDLGYKLAQDRYMDLDYSELPNDVQQKIVGWVEDRMVSLHVRWRRILRARGCEIFKQTESFTIRTAKYKELMYLDKHRLLPIDIEFLMTESKQVTVLIYEDNWDAWGYFGFFPLDKSVYEQVKRGTVIPSRFHYLDIGAIMPKHVFIITHFLQKRVLSYFIDVLMRVLYDRGLLRSENDPADLLICGIDAVSAGEKLWDKYMFKKSATLKNKETGEMMNFYEIEWGELKQQIEG